MKSSIYTLILIITLAQNSLGQSGIQPLCPSESLNKGISDAPNRTLVPDSERPQVNFPPTNPAGPDDRIVFWLHGLGGNSNSWSRAATVSEVGDGKGFSGRKIISMRMDYEQEVYHIADAGNKVKNDIWMATKTDEEELKRKNFIIAHSQGGVVARQVDKYLDNPEDESIRGYGGIVTFTTPHGGAHVLNNIMNNELEMFTQRACADLFDGPFAEKIEANKEKFNIKFLGGLINFNLIDEVNKRFNLQDYLVDSFCRFLSTTLPPYIMSNILDNKGIADDYMVGAPKITELAGHENPDIHKVAFWSSGNGSKWIPPTDFLMARTLHYQINSPNAYHFFGANDEQVSVDAAIANHASYLAKQAFWKAKSEDYQLLAEKEKEKWDNFKPNGQFPKNYYARFMKKSKDCLYVSNEYAKGTNWWITVNDQFKTLIAALEVNVKPTYICKCEHTVTLEVTQSIISDPADCDPNPAPYKLCEVVLGNPVITYDERDSDGIVLTDSQKAYPGAIIRNADPDNPATHMQIRNGLATKRALNDLYSGNIPEAKFFKTDEK